MERSLPDDLQALLKRKERFTYDLRGRCQVYEGVLAAYRAPDGKDHFSELADVIKHAMEHDGIVAGRRDPGQGHVHYDSCRIFTDRENALRFACAQGQHSVYSLTRDMEIFIPSGDTQHIL